MLELIRTHLAHTVWADRQHLEALSGVAPDHLTLDTGSSHASLLGTMAHLLGAEQLWLSRFLGNPLHDLPGVESYPDLESLRMGFMEHGAGFEFFLASLSSEQLQSDVHWVDPEGQSHQRPLWQPLMHMVQHSGYHRGQLTTMLRQLGYPAPATDLIRYLLSR